MQRRALLVSLFGLVVTSCSSSEGSSTATGSGSGSGDAGKSESGTGTGTGSAPGDVVWIDTPVLEHTKDFHSIDDYMNPAVPTDWTSPVNYADGDVTVRIEIVEASNPAAVPIYYLIGWGPGDGSDGYIRGGAKFDKASGVQEERVPVKSFQRVVDGKDAGDVGNQWNWKNAFKSPNGDTWASGSGSLYPIKVKVRLTLHPKK